MQLLSFSSCQNLEKMHVSSDPGLVQHVLSPQPQSMIELGIRPTSLNSSVHFPTIMLLQQSQKLVTLLVLVTTHRMQTFHLLISLIYLTTVWILKFSSLLESRPPSLRVLNRSVRGNVATLFITTCPPFHSTSSSTLDC